MQQFGPDPCVVARQGLTRKTHSHQIGSNSTTPRFAVQVCSTSTNGLALSWPALWLAIDVFECLLVSVHVFQKHSRTQRFGSAWVSYVGNTRPLSTHSFVACGERFGYKFEAVTLAHILFEFTCCKLCRTLRNSTLLETWWDRDTPRMYHRLRGRPGFV